MSRDKRKRLLAASDRLMDVIEGERLRGRSRRRLSDDLWDQLARLGDLVRYEPDPPVTYREAHRWLFRLQARRLLLVRPSTQFGSRREARAAGWRRMGLPQPYLPWESTWWEAAEAMLERLEARWDYAATWARRDPCRRRVRAMLAAWEDYFSARAHLEDLAAERTRRIA